MSHSPHFVDLETWAQDVLIIMVTGLVLTGVVARSRDLVRRQIAVAHERANLSRFFPPTVVDELAGREGMLEEIRRQDVAVLFTDLVGFTTLSEEVGPEGTILLLRGLHRRLEHIVFEHGGTLDKFLGDGAMATFGTPRPGDRDAANALDAARAILVAVDRWNAKRESRGAAPVRISVGVHYGPVVLGDVGSERRLEFAVIGDTVNATSRIEALTRQLDTRLAASDALMARAREQGAETADFADAGDHALRGRNAPVRLWRLVEGDAS